MIPTKFDNLTEISYAYKVGANGNYIGFLLDFPGVMSQAKSEEELGTNLIDALACMASYEQNKNAMAVPSFLFDGSYVKSKMKIPATA